MGPSPAVATVRHAVRGCLADLAEGDLVLAACSGGADSLALAAALAFVAPRIGLRAGGVTVDHGLQDGSAARAEAVVVKMRGFGLDPVLSVAVKVGTEGGLEAAAREARYAALTSTAQATDAAAVLLGHTLDDQAETVLLGLARGSGPRSLAGMPASRGVFRRPLLGIRRAVTEAAAASLDPWQDPHNTDRGFARARVRHEALPALEAALGPGVAEALARTAAQLRADADFFDGIFAERDRANPALDIDAVEKLPEAIRTRVLRACAVAAGCPPGALTAEHVHKVDELVVKWHGQRWIDLPGGIRAWREGGVLRFGHFVGRFVARRGEDGRGGHGAEAKRGADQRGAAAGQDR